MCMVSNTNVKDAQEYYLMLEVEEHQESSVMIVDMKEQTRNHYLVTIGERHVWNKTRDYFGKP